VGRGGVGKKSRERVEKVEVKKENRRKMFFGPAVWSTPFGFGLKPSW
jgi:hypothetical protein